ncbi:MAG: hypothetical protein O2843_04840 [Chloroflexi bacterium]|nr:hypothetical protein [Chloroflexota bacterium]
MVVVIRSLHLEAGSSRGLTATLDAAEAAEAHGNEHATLGSLGAFANQLRPQSGKALSEDHADLLAVLVAGL